MKKIIICFLVALMVFSMTACSDANKATITFDDKSTETVSVNKLVKLYEEDPDSFYEKYPDGTEITFEDSINSFLDNETVKLNCGIVLKLNNATVDSIGISDWTGKDKTVKIVGTIIESGKMYIEVSLTKIILVD